jgi:hypothetical protein
VSLSRDPEKRANQLANLKLASNVTHGAHSGALIRQATAEHLTNLIATFPSATQEELVLQATRMAQIERLAAFLEQRGLIRDRRTGAVFAAADLLAKLSTAFERQHAVLLEREQVRRGAGAQSLEDIVAELTADGDG